MTWPVDSVIITISKITNNISNVINGGDSYDKKERVTAAIRGEEVDKIPSGFSLHFPKESAFGDAAVKAHLKFFEESDTDILKIMNENLVPYMGEINHGSDYSMVKEMTMEDGFMQDQVELVKKILAGCGRDAFILGTLHGITASAIHPLEKMDPNYTYDQVREKLCRLLHEDEDTVLAGMKRIADVMCELAGTYIELGVDGVYYAALGGETRFFTDEEFDKWIKPFDLQIMKAIKDAGGYCFLHICKDQLNMDRYKDYGPYADVVNWGVYEAPFSLEDGRKMFAGKTIMGGLPNRHGVLVDGPAEAVKEETRKVIEDFGRTHFILGADCTLATEQDMDLLKAAVEAARE